MRYNNFIQFTLQVLLSLVLVNKVQAQTEPMYSQYMHNQVAINPAYAGNREALNLNFFQRRQWIGIDGAPQTSSVSIDKSFNDNKLGWGLQLFDDRLGVEKATGANFMLSSKIRISENGYLSGGLSTGLMNYRIDLLSVTGRFTPSDPAFYSNFNKWVPNVGLGVFYNTDKFYAGVSIPNVLKSRLSAFDIIRSGLQKVNNYHVFITSGYVFDVNEDLKIKPSTMIKLVSGAPIQVDLNTNVWLKNIFGFGFSYRTNDAFVSMLELQASSNIKIGYAYDRTISPYKYYNNGSHELMLRLEIGEGKAKVKSTRYF
jgi:type IX secretion system PorP/SprF family membrane protein